MANRPNILFLMTDEHRADITGYEGNEVIRTSRLDELASTGVVFRNAYTPSPICIPCRQAMMAGQLPKTCCCERWAEDLKPGYMTFARQFSRYAYSTVACGKLHHMGNDQMQGWTHRIGDEAQISREYIEDRVDEEFNKYQRGNGKWSDTKEALRAGIGYGNNQRVDEYTIQGALNYIEKYFNDSWYDREQSDRPLMLKVSLIQPHYPYFTSEEKFNYYLNRVPLYLNQSPADHPFLSQRQVRPGIDASEREIRRAVAAYYGMIETADDQFGRVLDALEQVGQNLNDWIIIYTSDHGEMLGEHGVWEKQKFYEGSVRVPLIIRWPKGFPTSRVIQENVNLCDLFATLCELCDIPKPEGLDSRSLVPLLEGKTEGWNNETVSQFGGRNLMIKRDNLKYQYYGEDLPEVLFDLERNPEETVNYIADPQYQMCLKAFRKRCYELGFGLEASENYINAGY